MRLHLERRWPKADYTIGRLTIDGELYCNTLELPWRDNRNNVSCIPSGSYMIQCSYSPKFKRILPRLLDVPKRSGILIHRGNTAKDTSGCILVGRNTEVGKVTNSTRYEEELVRMLHNEQKRGGINIITIE